MLTPSTPLLVPVAFAVTLSLGAAACENTKPVLTERSERFCSGSMSFASPALLEQYLIENTELLVRKADDGSFISWTDSDDPTRLEFYATTQAGCADLSPPGELEEGGGRDVPTQADINAMRRELEERFSQRESESLVRECVVRAPYDATHGMTRLYLVLESSGLRSPQVEQANGFLYLATNSSCTLTDAVLSSALALSGAAREPNACASSSLASCGYPLRIGVRSDDQE